MLSRDSNRYGQAVVSAVCIITSKKSRCKLLPASWLTSRNRDVLTINVPVAKCRSIPWGAALWHLLWSGGYCAVAYFHNSRRFSSGHWAKAQIQNKTKRPAGPFSSSWQHGKADRLQMRFYAMALLDGEEEAKDGNHSPSLLNSVSGKWHAGTVEVLANAINRSMTIRKRSP